MSKKKLLLSAIFGAGALFMLSCGGGSSSSVSSSEQVGTLKLGVKFPKSGELTSQFLDENTKCVEVRVYSYNGEWFKTAILTPDNPVATITNIPIGDKFISVSTYDGVSPDGNSCAGNVLEQVNARAKIVQGENNFTINLLRAKWVFVDENGNPTSINLNGTLPDSNESVEGFYVLPIWDSSLSARSVDENRPSEETIYKVYFFGNNLNACNEADPSLCPTYGYYYVQLIGPNTSNNAFEVPFSVYADRVEAALLQSGPNGETRAFLILGVNPCYMEGYYSGYLYYDPYYGYFNPNYYTCSYNVSDSTLEDYTNTTVVNGNTIQGTAAEIMIKDINFQETCYTDINNPEQSQITCPGNSPSEQAAFIQKAVRSALAKSALTAQQTCMQDLTFTQTITAAANTAWMEGVQDINDIDNDGDTTEYLCDNNFDGKYDMGDDTNGNNNIECWPDYAGGDGLTYYVDTTGTITFDICLYPFTAKAQQIEPTDLNLNIQNK